MEYLLHFVLDRGKLEEERKWAFELQRPRVAQRQTVVENSCSKRGEKEERVKY